MCARVPAHGGYPAYCKSLNVARSHTGISILIPIQIHAAHRLPQTDRLAFDLLQKRQLKG